MVDTTFSTVNAGAQAWPCYVRLWGQKWLLDGTQNTDYEFRQRKNIYRLWSCTVSYETAFKDCFLCHKYNDVTLRFIIVDLLRAPCWVLLLITLKQNCLFTIYLDSLKVIIWLIKSPFHNPENKASLGSALLMNKNFILTITEDMLIQLSFTVRHSYQEHNTEVISFHSVALICVIKLTVAIAIYHQSRSWNSQMHKCDLYPLFLMYSTVSVVAQAWPWCARLEHFIWFVYEPWRILFIKIDRVRVQLVEEWQGQSAISWRMTRPKCN